MKKVVLILLLLCACAAGCSSSMTPEDKLRQWRRGVWMLADGSYAIYTDNHYFVVSASGDSSLTNLYCGGSQIRITDNGIARRQTLRIRQFPGGTLQYFKKSPPDDLVAGMILELDMSQFQPGTCNIHKEIIYDSITEITDEYILLSTCNGDREKIFSDGRSAYLPAGGGEHWARRIESW